MRDGGSNPVEGEQCPSPSYVDRENVNSMNIELSS